MSQNPKSRLTVHLLRASAYVAAFSWLAAAYTGGVLVSRPDTGTHSRLAGWAILFVAAAIAMGTMRHWVKYLQLIFGVGILGGLLVVGTGHMLNDPRTFSRPMAAAMTVLLIGCSLASRPLARRQLTVPDRVALIAFLAAFAGGTVEGAPLSGLIGLAVGFGCLSLAWGYDRFIKGRAPSSPTGRFPAG